MARISGVNIIKDSKGFPKKAVFDLKLHPEIEDYLDHLEIQARKDEETTPWEEVKKELEKKHGIKPKK